MTSELSIYAARLREFVSLCADEFDASASRLSAAEAQPADAEFNALALVLFALQFSHNAPYRRICETRGVTPVSLTHWSQIPAVPTAAFKELEMSCLPPEERTHVFHSSGTTEQRPSRHFHNAESLSVYEASLWSWFWKSLRFAIYDLRLLVLTPAPGVAPHSSLIHMFEAVRRKLGADANSFVGRLSQDGGWLLDFESAKLGMERACQDGKPALLLGTAFSFVHLLDTLETTKLHFQLPPGSKVMETGGYKGRSRSLPKAELHALITERLGVPATHIVCEYGMSELSSQAYDQVAGGPSRITHHASCVFRFPPWVRVRVISPETGCEVAEGETGLLRVFDLANVYSVLAVQTEDLAIRRGDGFELIGRAQLAESRGCSLMAN